LGPLPRWALYTQRRPASFGARPGEVCEEGIGQTYALRARAGLTRRRAWTLSGVGGQPPGRVAYRLLSLLHASA